MDTKQNDTKDFKKRNKSTLTPQEEWRDVVGYEGFYQVSSLGRIKSTPRRRTKGGLIKLHLNKGTGYLGFSLSKNGEIIYANVHRLMAEAFIPNPENKATVNHKNSIRSDNRLENLEWNTSSENNKHAYEFGYNKITENHLSHKTKKPVLQYDLHGNFIREFISARYVEREYRINHANIRKCCLGRYKQANGFIWKYKY